MRGDGEAGLNDVDAERIQVARKAHLLFQSHAATGRLFAITQGGVEDPHSRVRHLRGLLGVKRLTDEDGVRLVISQIDNIE